MNNNYNFMSNSNYMRNVPIMPNYIAPVPRINTLFGKTNTQKITFSSILNGASKTLGVINQAIPVFYQVKPIWNNARTMLKVAKGLKSNTEPNIKETPIKETKKEHTNAPTFFA